MKVKILILILRFLIGWLKMKSAKNLQRIANTPKESSWSKGAQKVKSSSDLKKVPTNQKSHQPRSKNPTSLKKALPWSLKCLDLQKTINFYLEKCARRNQKLTSIFKSSTSIKKNEKVDLKSCGDYQTSKPFIITTALR